MLLDHPHLITAVLYALGAIFAHWLTTLDGQIVPTLGWLVQYPLGAAALFSLYDWFRSQNVNYLERIRKAKAITQSTLLAEKLASLDNERLQILKIEMGLAEPQEQDQGTTRIGGIDVPDEFVQKYFHAASGHKLVPIRKFSEGSKERLYAKTIVDHLEQGGALYPAAGNQPPTVKDWRKVMSSIGWE